MRNRLDKNTSTPKHICDSQNALRNQRRKKYDERQKKRDYRTKFGQS